MDEDPTMCSECGAEPAASPQATATELTNEGWDLEGEFGARCPGCVAENVQPGAEQEFGGDALTALAAGVVAEKRVAAEKPKAKRKKKAKAKK